MQHHAETTTIGRLRLVDDDVAPTATTRSAEDYIGAVKSTAATLRFERDSAQRRTNQLFDVCIKYGGEQGLREAYHIINHPVMFRYYALKGTKMYKNGSKTAWLSVSDKFQGKYRGDGEQPPVCNGYMPYNWLEPEDFVYDETSKTLRLKHREEIEYRGKVVKVVKE
jgi:hypothetical protein